MATVEAGGGTGMQNDKREEQALMSDFLESLARYQDVMKNIQFQAKQLMAVG